jgi:hypothetical protein
MSNISGTRWRKIRDLLTAGSSYLPQKEARRKTDKATRQAEQVLGANAHLGSWLLSRVLGALLK